MAHTAALVAGYWRVAGNTPGPFLAAGTRPSMTVLVTDDFPPKVQISVTGLTPGQVVSVTRRQAGETTRVVVRGLDEVTATSDALVSVDAEEPLGVALTYVLTIDGADVEDHTITADYPGVALTDAINGNAAQIIILAWPDQSRTRNATVFSVAGQNIVVTGPRGQFSSAIEVYTETETARQSMLTLLDNATAGIIQLRNGVGHFGEDGYYAVIDDTETRWSPDGSDERRRWTLNAVQVGPWAEGLLTSAFTLADIGAAYMTLADLAANYPTLLAISLGDFS